MKGVSGASRIGRAEGDPAEQRRDEDDRAGDAEPGETRSRSRPEGRDDDHREADGLVEIDRRPEPPLRVRRDLVGGDDAGRKADGGGDHPAQEVERVAEHEEPHPAGGQAAEPGPGRRTERGAHEEHEDRCCRRAGGQADRLADRRRPGLAGAPVPQDMDEDHEEDGETGGQVERPDPLARGDAGHRVHEHLVRRHRVPATTCLSFPTSRGTALGSVGRDVVIRPTSIVGAHAVLRISQRMWRIRHQVPLSWPARVRVPVRRDALRARIMAPVVCARPYPRRDIRPTTSECVLQATGGWPGA